MVTLVSVGGGKYLKMYSAVFPEYLLGELVHDIRVWFLTSCEEPALGRTRENKWTKREQMKRAGSRYAVYC